MKNLLIALVVCTLVFAVTDTQARQWYNKDGLTVRQHAELVHHYSTAGMTDEQVIAENDHYHNMYGGYHNHVHKVSYSHVDTVTVVIPSPTIPAPMEMVSYTVPVAYNTMLPRTQVPTLAPRLRSNLQSLRARLRAIRPLRSILCR